MVIILEPNSTPMVWLLSSLTSCQSFDQHNFLIGWNSFWKEEIRRQSGEFLYIFFQWNDAASMIFQYQHFQSQGTWKETLS